MELVAGRVFERLASLAEIASTYGVGREIERLEKSVESIGSVLEPIRGELSDDDRKQLIKRRIRERKQALCKADDLLDELYTQSLLRKRDAYGDRVCDFVSSIFFRRRIARIARIGNSIREKFSAVTENFSKLNYESKGDREEFSYWRVTGSFVRTEDIVGREEEKRYIIKLLLNHDNDDDGSNNNQNVSLLTILGIGGIGKTALAQLVYNDAQVECSFDKRMWVCVSQEFDVKVLVRQILEELLHQREDDHQPFELELLQTKLDGQKFLLVLDDVWDVDPKTWRPLREALMCGAEGSKILLTTRNPKVVEFTSDRPRFILRKLSEEQSWDLLKRLAFDEDKLKNQNLEYIGIGIALKCYGLPLAIRVAATLLRSKSPESEWEAILEGYFWNPYNINDSSMSALKSSYDSLPVGLKQCVAYFSLYPKDWEHKKDELISLWMAQGFLENKSEQKCPEDIGEDNVRRLFDSLFLQVAERDELGDINYFKLHDLMHDLSRLIASDDYVLYFGGREHVVRFPIHGSFDEYHSERSPNMLDDLHRLRTFVEIKKNQQRDPSDLFKFKRLRSLDLSSYMMRYLHPSIGEMIHLRYLNLSCCYALSYLPYSISKLVNLQTLILSFCGNLELPGDIVTKLISLRRLDIDGCKAFEDGMPVGLGKMTSLQSLSHFTVGKVRKKSKLNELKELNLRGGLTIQSLASVIDVEEESKDVNLRTKENLSSMTLKWGPYSERENNNAKELLDNLCPHEKLKSLTIEEYPGEHLSDWLSSCKNLVRLRFFDMRNCLHLTALEGLDSLKTLHMERMDKLKFIHCKSYSSSTNFFTSLEELKIRRCESLIGWQREGNAQNTGDDERDQTLPPFPRLSSLQVNRCPKLNCMPTFPDLVGRLELAYSSTKPLLDTLNVSTVGPSTSSHVAASLSKLKSLHIEGIDIESLPGEWMHNLSSLEHLSIASFSSPEKPFRHMQNLSATLERFTIRYLQSWRGNEDYNIQSQDLRCLHSLQRIEITSCHHLITLPQWICELQSLQLISIQFCEKLEAFPEEMQLLTNLQQLQLEGAPLLKERCKRQTGAEWTKISHIPNLQIDLDQICPSLHTSEA